MTVTVNVRSDLASQVARLRARAPQAITRALNRAATSARVVAVREIARDMGLTQTVIKSRVGLEEARPATPVARLSASLKRIPLVDFNARGPEPSRGRGRGVTARLPGGRGRYPRAFIATMASGHRGVFERVPGGKRRGQPPNRPQLPIYELMGPSIGKVFEKYFDVAARRGQEQLVKNLQSEFRFLTRSVAAA